MISSAELDQYYYCGGEFYRTIIQFNTNTHTCCVQCSASLTIYMNICGICLWYLHHYGVDLNRQNFHVWIEFRQTYQNEMCLYSIHTKTSPPTPLTTSIWEYIWMSTFSHFNLGKFKICHWSQLANVLNTCENRCTKLLLSIYLSATYNCR